MTPNRGRSTVPGEGWGWIHWLCGMDYRSHEIGRRGVAAPRSDDDSFENVNAFDAPQRSASYASNGQNSTSSLLTTVKISV